MEDKIKKTVDDCYLEYDEDGYLTCSFNHKIGDECLLHTKEEEKKLKEDYLSNPI